MSQQSMNHLASLHSLFGSLSLLELLSWLLQRSWSIFVAQLLRIEEQPTMQISSLNLNLRKQLKKVQIYLMNYKSVYQTVEREEANVRTFLQSSQVKKRKMNSMVRMVKAKRGKEGCQGIINQVWRPVLQSFRSAKMKKQASVRSQRSAKQR